MKKLLPIVLLLIGSGAGVGAGIFLRPAPVETPVAESDKKEDTGKSAKTDDGMGEKDAALEYMKLSNQFVIHFFRSCSIMQTSVALTARLQMPKCCPNSAMRCAKWPSGIWVRMLCKTS